MATFLLEVGTEELPASFVSSAIAQWQAKIPQSLKENLLTYDSLEVYGTPRRLAVVIKALPSRQPDREEEIKGPPVKAAFKDGKPTKAAEGFARKQGISIEDFTTRDTPKGEFIFVEKKIPGRATQEILTELILPWITGLEGKRFMRWADGDFRFSRPIRWLVSLLDEEILPLEIVNGSSKINSDRLSSGHRVLHPEPVTISHAEDYVKCLKYAYIEVDSQGRSTNISQQVQQAAKE
jgi:glycyl-tRNA synthetase beta chain